MAGEAVKNITEILEAPVSAIMVVAGDMSIDLGLGPAPGEENHPEVDAAYKTVLEARAGILVRQSVPSA